MAILTVPLKRQLKRVILKFRINDFKSNSFIKYDDAIIIYFIFTGRSSSESKKNKFFTYIKPF
jgi:hypothetical protein